MKKIWIYLSIFAIFVGGCASIKELNIVLSGDRIIYDRIPNDLKKGYIQFIVDDIDNTEQDLLKECRLFILEYGNKFPVSIGPIIFSNAKTCLFAERPGVHTYLIELGSVYEKIEIEVAHGMISPIRAFIISKGKTGKYLSENKYKTYHFDFHVKTELPKPIELRPHESNKESTGFKTYDMEHQKMFSLAVEAVEKTGWKIKSVDRVNKLIYAIATRTGANNLEFIISVYTIENNMTQIDMSSIVNWQVIPPINTRLSAKKMNKYYEQLDLLIGKR